MKAKDVKTSFTVPLAIGRSAADLFANATPEQLDLFRSSFGVMEQFTCLGLFALTDPKNKAALQDATYADLLRVLGYTPKDNADGKLVFNSADYKRYGELILNLYRQEIPLYIRERVFKGEGKKRRRFQRGGVVFLRPLQEIGYGYVDEDGNAIDLNSQPKDQIVEVAPAIQGAAAVKALVATDKDGQPIRNKDGTFRRRPAPSFFYRWSTRLIEAMDQGGGWYFYLRYFDLIKRNLHKPIIAKGYIYFLFSKPEYGECSHAKLVEHLGNGTKDRQRQEQQIKELFESAIRDGIIVPGSVQTKEADHWPVTKTGRRRRRDLTYKWKIKQEAVALPGGTECLEDGLPESMKEGIQDE